MIFESAKFIIRKAIITIDVGHIQSFIKSRVKVVGISTQTVVNHIKCLKKLTQTSKKGIISIKYMFVVLNHLFDRLFTNFEIKNNSFI